MKMRRWIDAWLRSLGVAFLLFLVIRSFFVEAFQIPSGSMERTLLVGDFLLVNKFVYGAEIPGTKLRFPALTEPKRGDVVVFRFPKDPNLNYVKRIVAIGGDTVAMRQGRLFLNGRGVEEPYAVRAQTGYDPTDRDFAWQREFFLGSTRSRWYRRPSRSNWGPLYVPPGKFFMLGDNRNNSSDSRYWGFVDVSAVRGRPEFVYFSYDRSARTHVPWLSDIRWARLGSTIR